MNNKIYKFEEVLNDLVDYFILGDPEYLLQYKIKHNLPDDLLTEFTTQDTGDIVVENGVIIPMVGIENHPYTIYFNLSSETPELFKPENILLHECDGYCLRVENGEIYLFTIPYLDDYTSTRIESLKKHQKATITLENGWYTVTILGGLTQQNYESKMSDGTTKNTTYMQPTFEFLLKPSSEKPDFNADIPYPFEIES